MKKTFFTAVAMSAALFSLQAQTELKTYDANDANLNGEVNVGDAEYVANHVLTQTAGSEVVTSADLNAVLKDIYLMLGQLANEHEGIKQRLNILMKESGVSNPFEPDENGIITNGYEYVDLGVVVNGKRVFWATTNIGAEFCADFGDYFAWGETEPKTSFEVSSYQFATHIPSGGWVFENIGEGISGTEYDAAHVLWQGSWRMPTTDELEALRTQCNWKKGTIRNTSDQFVLCFQVSNRADSNKCIYLPAGGYYLDRELQDVKTTGYYWSGSLFPTGSYYDARFLKIQKGETVPYPSFDNALRSNGLLIRPVCSQ